MILSRNSSENHWVSTFKTNTTWNKFYSSDLRLVKSTKLRCFDVVPEIEQLVKQLAKVPNVERVVALATRFPNLHWIDFELFLSENELTDEIWDRVQDLVIDCEWKLRDNSGEKWYFRPQIADQSQLRNGQEVLIDSHVSKFEETSIKTWSSPPLKLVVH
jgi:hypothetical protein